MKLIFSVMLMLSCTIGVVAGEDYSHQYDTFEIGFSTPSQVTADVQWGTEKAGMSIRMDLSTGESLFVFPHKFSTWDSRDISKANLEKLWISYADGNRYYTPTISKLGNGDFLVTGRMMLMKSKITRTMRTFDFNGDGRLDYIVFWNGNGTIDYDLLNYLASTTKVRLIGAKSKSSGTPASSASRSCPLRRTAFIV